MKNKTETFCQNDKQQINQLLTINSKKKMKNLFLTGLLGLGVFCSCSNEDDPANYGKLNEGEAYAQIMISVASSSTTGTRTTTSGSTGDDIAASASENNIQSITVVLADENDIAQQVITPVLKTEIDAEKEIRATEPFTVNAGKYKVYVLANYEQNKDNLSPVIVGSTDMKQTFTITGSLSKENAFFMTNADDVTTTDFTQTAIGEEVDDDGKTESNPETLHLVKANIERVVSKVTFDNTDNQEELSVKDGTTEIAKATLNGVSLINLNKKMYLTKKKVSVSATNTWTKYFYVEDPNYNNTTDLENNFAQAKASDFSNPSAAAFYCPENTMAAAAQLNGQTTGVVYKVIYTPDTNNGYSVLIQNGTDIYSQKFTAVLALDTHNAAITDNMFKDELEVGPKAGSFYEYKGFIFKNKNAAYLYCAIDKNLSAEASAINTAFEGYLTKAPADVHLYEAGVCYYTAWIKHNPKGAQMEAGKYGTVRNHWYELKVTGINALGHYEPTYKDPTDPDDPAKATIQVQATVKKWVLVKQDVTLE